MAKKTNKKPAKALPSALTIASPTGPHPEISPARVGKAAGLPRTSAAAAAPESHQEMTRDEAAQRPIAPQTVQVAFDLHEPQAKEVSLCGEFNGWSPGATPMKPQGNGVWRTTLLLPPGRYQYKFVVDGQWWPDVKAKENVLNEHGTLNSVINVQAAIS